MSNAAFPMAPDTQLEEIEPTSANRTNFWRDVVFGSKVSRIGIIILVFFTFVAIFEKQLAPYNPRVQVGPPYEAPNSSHWLGTDDGGNDMLSLVIYGARVSMLVGFAGAAVAILIGGAVGLLAGYFGGKSDIVLMRTTDYFLVIPDVPLMIVAAAVFGRNLINIIVIIGVIYWASTARLIRAQVITVRERIYVKRARALGARNGRIMKTHILPQVMPLIVANTVLMVATAVFAETYIAFLGLGSPSEISWGKLIQNSLEGDAVFHSAWWAIIPPGLCVTVVILACTMMGQAMEDSLNPRLKVGHLSVKRFRLRPLVGRPGAK
jgi:peptide/nickel transport system permease protein